MAQVSEISMEAICRRAAAQHLCFFFFCVSPAMAGPAVNLSTIKTHRVELLCA